MRSPKALFKIYRTLYQELGPQHWWPAETAFEVIVGAVLTQNTAWSNVEKAVNNLKNADVLSLQNMKNINIAKLTELIRPSGYFNLKAKRLMSVVRWLWDMTQGNMSILSDKRQGPLRRELLQIYGVGPETADSILLYALHKKSFVVDAYTKRIFSRHGFLDFRDTYEVVKSIFESALPKSEKIYNEFHAMIVYIGKNFCKSNPKCDICPLNDDLKRMKAA